MVVVLGQRRRTEVTLKHFRLLFLKESDPFIYRSLVCFLSRPRARAFKKFLLQSRERACVILDLSSLRIHLRIMHVETRGNLDARRQDLTRALAHVFPPPPLSLFPFSRTGEQCAYLTSYRITQCFRRKTSRTTRRTYIEFARM